MDQLLEKLKAGIQNAKRLKWPGTDVDIDIRVLSEHDHHEASMAADRIYKVADINVGVENVDNYEAERTVQLLWRAVRNPETGGHVAKNITEFRTLLTRDARNILVDELNAFERECSPSPENLTDEQFDELFARVKKNAAETITSVSSISLAKRLIVCLAAPQQTLPADSGST